MEEVSGDGSFSLTPELSSGEANDNERPSEAPQETPLTMSASFRDGGKSLSRRRAAVRPSLDAYEFLNLLHRNKKKINEEKQYQTDGKTKLKSEEKKLNLQKNERSFRNSWTPQVIS
ncbi:unnamed protein product [Fraxinus pennsylvanica]|uniref:Uncharacterized protein n=1 Tax=Fraxinus pennsylvanica TaxID=56036 RepID=A0AAD1YU69_9LAMI|nr:unnamed protein product [Fraxinus pennsylvanica]